MLFIYLKFLFFIIRYKMFTQTKLIINSEINGPEISAKGKKYIQNEIFEIKDDGMIYR